LDADKFKRSNQYDKLLDGYNNKLVEIIYPPMAGSPSPKAPPSKTPTIADVKRQAQKKRDEEKARKER
jgi:hypothetical protein